MVIIHMVKIVYYVMIIVLHVKINQIYVHHVIEMIVKNVKI